MAVRALFLLACLAVAHAKLWDLSCKQVRAMVDGHNSRRLLLARGEVPGHPAAAEMNYMIWDDELAAKAAKWASRNQFVHNPDTSIGSGRFSTGENIYWYSTTEDSYKLDPDAPLKAWFDEYKEYSYRPLDSGDFDGSGPDIGHYTQMAWAGSSYVGCAISQYSGDNGWNSFFVVCNYGPAGNYIGQTPYPSGTAAGYLQCGISDCSRQYGDKC